MLVVNYFTVFCECPSDLYCVVSSRSVQVCMQLPCVKNIFCCVLSTLGSDSVFGQQPAFAGAPEGPLLIVLAFVGLFSEADKSAL